MTLPALGVDSTTLPQRLLDARFVAVPGSAAIWSAGLCGVEKTSAPFAGRCHVLGEGLLTTRRDIQNSGAMPAETDVRSGWAYEDGAWVAFDRLHRPASAAGASLSLQDHAGLPGGETWTLFEQDVGGRALSEIISLVFGASVDAGETASVVLPAGAKLYRAQRRMEYPERLVIDAARTPLATVEAGLDELLVQFAAGNGADASLAYRKVYGPVSGCCILGVWEQDEAQFAADGQLVRRNNNLFFGGEITALPGGTWQRTAEFGTDALVLRDDQENRIATLVAREGSVHAAKRLPAVAGADAVYLFDAATYGLLMDAFCPECLF